MNKTENFILTDAGQKFVDGHVMYVTAQADLTGARKLGLNGPDLHVVDPDVQVRLRDLLSKEYSPWASICAVATEIVGCEGTAVALVWGHCVLAVTPQMVDLFPGDLTRVEGLRGARELLHILNLWQPPHPPRRHGLLLSEDDGQLKLVLGLDEFFECTLDSSDFQKAPYQIIDELDKMLTDYRNTKKGGA